MVFPKGWPPGEISSYRNVRVYAKGTTTANFSDNAWLFGQFPSVNNTLPTVAPGSVDPVVIPPCACGPKDGSISNVTTCRFFEVYNDGPGDLELSFDGVNVHGYIKASDISNFGPHIYEDRMEGGVCFRTATGSSSAADFRLEGW